MNQNALISLVAEINHRARKLIVKKLKEKGVEGIVSSHGDILVNLFEKGPLHQQELARLIRREKNTTTVLLRKLEQNGLVTRTPSSVDKRKTIISLTEKAENMKPAFYEISEELLTVSYRGFSEEDKVLLLSLLHRLNENLK